MKSKRMISWSFLLMSVFIIVGCSNYQEDFTFTGIIVEKLVEDEMLVMKEYGGSDEGRIDGNIYEIPVDKVEGYNVGQKLEITVFSNTDADVWDLDHMKFEIRSIAN
ncbi:hypothetical protein [Paenisporosarcina sp. TG20]|uniref:hypothetical protein n=1 Tax=Paenisporosarcina sp. TG20 TaxID=1211706 RepID=UPI0002D2B2C6|nr:hypothetical protein [Paenisporosarcina sp. TG20]